ncbi:hypothetical protein AYJ54_43215 [Bradyrhizobium centrolobii]|uniref:Uncharacterized protein n=1 Tax=Bradyrhizobium centrolobii TaxID=1505087 RepID=A0A176Z0K0_9BRAD|nr:hypothetical protein AYJ54_43215 [Bradyrhizobium centrolobii]
MRSWQIRNEGRDYYERGISAGQIAICRLQKKVKVSMADEAARKINRFKRHTSRISKTSAYCEGAILTQ